MERKRRIRSVWSAKDGETKYYYFTSHVFGTTCDIRVMDINKKQIRMQAKLRAPQNPHTQWHEIDIGEMLARTNLELVR